MPDLSSLMTFDTLVSFLALTFLEVVLGVDNIVFVALAADTGAGGGCSACGWPWACGC